MATSGTNTFNLDIEQLIDEAYDLIESDENASARDLSKARRTLNLIFIQLLNKGIPLWKTAQVEVTTSSSAISYTLNSNILDILDGSIEVSSSSQVTEIPLNKIGIFEYTDIPVKEQEGRPTQYTVDRYRDNKIVRVWPTPTSTQYVMKFWAVQKVEDVGAYSNNADIEYRYLPAIVNWLAYELGKKRPNKTEEFIIHLARLEKDYMTMLQEAEDMDSERGSFMISPLIYGG